MYHLKPLTTRKEYQKPAKRSRVRREASCIGQRRLRLQGTGRQLSFCLLLANALFMYLSIDL